MATLVLGTVGTLIGGPLGGAIGTFLGRSIDGELFGPSAVQGPRLEELSVTTSTYGQTLARHYGKVRSSGSLIWATDFKEQSETSGGKGQPNTTTYSYSVSFAVALAARPIDGLGRIWADGNLLRGAAGDLKTAGQLRVHHGHGDQMLDPLIAADLADHCPAHRGLAYVVFEDLQLADFGNRIPALTFEIFAGGGSDVVEDVLSEANAIGLPDLAPDGLEGFSYKTGTVRQIVQLLDVANPLVPITNTAPLQFADANSRPVKTIPLSSKAAWDEGEFGQQSGVRGARGITSHRQPVTVRYYDIQRDYQLGLQRSSGYSASGDTQTLDYPASLSAISARNLAQKVSRRRDGSGSKMFWRLAELDPDLAPGELVQLEGEVGLWRIVAWEWREGGVELELERYSYEPETQAATDYGAAWSPLDRLPAATSLRAFELPWDGTGLADDVQIFAAVSAAEGRWAGSTLYTVRGDALIDLGSANSRKAICGHTAADLGPSRAQLFYPRQELQLTLADPEMQLVSTDLAGLSGGANRMLVGSEIVQFLSASETGAGQWLVSGLLRGRGATEQAAQAGHLAGTAVTLLDDRLTAVNAANIDPMSDRIAAIGMDDEAPVMADIENPGLSRKPLCPVHPRSAVLANGNLHLCWTRRARGAWKWLDEVETPLVEQTEQYQIGLGGLANPIAQWIAYEPELILDEADVAALSAAHSGHDLWVRQIGNFARSDALKITTLY